MEGYERDETHCRGETSKRRKKLWFIIIYIHMYIIVEVTPTPEYDNVVNWEIFKQVLR